MSRHRLIFRVLLAVGLAWSSYPTIAEALSTQEVPAQVARVGPSSTTVMTIPTSAAPTTPEITVTPSTTATTRPDPTPTSPPVAPTSSPPPPRPVETHPVAPTPLATVSAASAPHPAVPGFSCDEPPSDVLMAMNRDRRAGGLGDLCANAWLTQLADNWASWMAQNKAFQHHDLHPVIIGTPYAAMAENILNGPAYITADTMESVWMQSADHRTNILNSTYQVAGIGIAYSDDGLVWVVVDFGG